MLSLALVSFAHAALVEAWSYDDFPRDGGEIAGTGGWVAGYDEDPWVSAESDAGRWATPKTDHYSEDAFGSGGAIDNWLVNPAQDVRQGEFTTTVFSTDNDAFGVVFGHDGDAYYMLLVCGEEGDDTSNQNCPIEDLGRHATALVRVQGGGVEVLVEEDTGGRLYEEMDVVVSMDDGQLTARYGRLELSTEVGEEFRLSGVGFYGYNVGLVDEDGVEEDDSVFFRDPVLSWQDEDGDDVVDDEDNCEETANADQGDVDGDGLGSACDEDEDPGDDSGDTDDTDVTDTDDTDGTDTDDTDDTEDTDRPRNGPPEDDPVSLGGGCGCDTGGGLASLLTVLAAMVAARRREE